MSCYGSCTTDHRCHQSLCIVRKEMNEDPTTLHAKKASPKDAACIVCYGMPLAEWLRDQVPEALQPHLLKIGRGDKLVGAHGVGSYSTNG
eukprot:scaffold20328_cov127-Skeletonema_dohrnii-CCMP3373.AAC.1